ncbi:MAG TPA: LPS assembly protein LptD [Azospirillum sp.]|nr:LPS assembly protein LptD [Azospirillum sp.]
MTLLSGLLGLMVACGVATTASGQTQAPTTKDAQQPSLLAADQVTYDDVQGIVTARGNVELSQGLRTVRADVVTYNRRTKVVTATGNIRMVEPSGDILFADYAELTDDLRDAFVENLRVLMTDNSRMAGNEAERRGERLLRVNRGVYSPCELCPTDPTRPPVWQVRAVRVVHDREEREIRYKDAVIEMFGIPVAYTPYLSQPDPTVDRKSGFLTPLVGGSSDLGVFIRPRYYIDIAPDQDATVEVGAFTKQGLLLGGEYRKRFERGSLSIAGSVTQGELPVTLSDPGGPKEKKLRGHIFASGLFEIDEAWRAGFDARRASDETYLRKYYDFHEDYLTSRAFVEGFRGRNYAAVNAYSWQDLRYGNPVEEPIVGPLAVYNALGEPGSLLGGRWSLDSGILSLYRTVGTNTRRFYVQPGWRREIVSNVGFITTLDVSVLAATYNASHYDRPDIAGIDRRPTSATRLFPQGQVTVRYPFVRYGESSQQLIEPIAAFTAAPVTKNDPEIPNEDSLDVEFDQANLFLLNRFPGIDRQDGGTRFTYGLRTAIYGYNQGSGSLFLGQSYRFNRKSAFPIGSGLETRRSDYVGSLDLTPAPWLDLNYGFRLDQDTLRPRRHSVTGVAGVPAFTVSTAYTFLDQTIDPFAVSRNKLEQVSVGINSRFSPRWSVGLTHIQSLRPDPGPRAALGVLTYQDECFTFQTIARRDFTTVVGDVESGSTLYFRLVFKNLGEFRSPGLGGLFGGS